MGDEKPGPKLELPHIRELPGFAHSDPTYFKDPMIDRLLDIVLMMGGEFWAMRDRLMVLEQLLARHGQVTPELIETFEADPSFAEQLAGAREQFIRRVFGRLYPEGPINRGDHFSWLTERAPAPPSGVR